MTKQRTSFIANQKLRIVMLLVVAVVVGFGVSYFASGGNSDNKVRQVACEGTCVNLTKDKATPDTIAVTVGSYVSFNSADDTSHELILGEDSEHGHGAKAGSFNSGLFKSDESWRVQFKEEGTYIFRDKQHPKTNIIVVVYTAGKEYKVQ